MGLNVLIEVAIGLVAIYFLLAIACSYLIEALNSFMNVRGLALRRFVTEMVMGDLSAEQRSGGGRFRRWLHKFRKLPGGQPGSAASEAAQALDLKLLDHPLIVSLNKPVTDRNAVNTVPSYIPSELFSKALLDRIGTWVAPLSVPREVVTQCSTTFKKVVAPADHDSQPLIAALDRALSSSPGTMVNLLPLVVELLDRLAKVPDEAHAELIAKSRDLVGQAPEGIRSLLSSVLDALGGEGPRELTAVLMELGSKLPARELTFEVLMSAVRGGLPGPLGESLRSIVQTANHDLNEVRAGIERWYGSVMDRASGWFKRRATVMLGCVGFLMAAAFNLDTFDIARELFKDPTARSAASQLAGYVAGLSPERAASMLQQRAFVTALDDRKWLHKTGLEETKRVAREAQEYLVVSGETLWPMADLQTLASSDDVDPKVWAERTQSLVAAACRSRRRSTSSAGSGGLDKSAAELMKDPLCSGEATAVEGKPSSSAQERKARVCEFWGSRALALSWAPDAAVEAWSLISAQNARKPGCDSTKDLQDGKVFIKELRKAKEGVEEASARVATLLDRLPNVSLITTVARKNQWWRVGQTCDAGDGGPNSSSACKWPGGPMDFAPAFLAIVIGTVFSILLWRRRAMYTRKRTWRFRMFLTGLTILIALVLIADYNNGMLRIDPLRSIVAASLVVMAVIGMAIAVYDALREGGGVSLGAFVFFMLLLLAMLPILYFGVHSIAHGSILLAVPGWVATGLMVSYGSPFWYELLNKLVNQRVTGPKP